MSISTQEFDRSSAFREAQAHSKKVYLLRILLPICAVATLGLYLRSAEVSFEVEADKGKITGKIDLPGGKLLNPKYEGFDPKNGKYTVEAEYALPNLKTPNLIELHRIQAKADNKQQGWVRMQALKGLYDSRTESLDLTTEINISTNTGMTAKLKSANVDMKQQLITSDKPVAVNMPTGTVLANSMTYHSPTSLLSFRQNVQVHLKSAKAPSTQPRSADGGIGAMFQGSQDPIDVASETLEINNKKQTALFRGQVSAVQSDVTLQADTLQIDYHSGSQPEGQTAEGAGDSQKISQVVANQNVVITTGDGRKARAQTSIFDNGQQTVTLENSVTVEQGKNTLKGDKLVIDLKKRHSYFPPGGRVQGMFVPAVKEGQKKPKKQITPEMQQGSGQPASLAESFSSFADQGDEPFNITANSLDIFDAKKLAIFKGNVEVIRAGNQIRSGFLQMEYVGNAPLSGAPDQSSQDTGAQIKQIIARNKVLITTPNNQTVTSEEAVFDVASDSVTINGNVVLSQGENVLKGNKLVINLKTGKYRFETGKERVRAVFTPGNIQVPNQVKKPETSQ